MGANVRPGRLAFPAVDSLLLLAWMAGRLGTLTNPNHREAGMRSSDEHGVTIRENHTDEISTGKIWEKPPLVKTGGPKWVAIKTRHQNGRNPRTMLQELPRRPQLFLAGSVPC